jgi:S-DNA-T family DNA segregation ATPase FtsK/SpoIIIE
MSFKPTERLHSPKILLFYAVSFRGYSINIIDEIHELHDKKNQNNFNRLLRLGRAEGIFNIACTQRPSGTTYEKFTDSRALFRAKICFAMPDIVNSQIVLNNNKAAEIKNVGRAIYQRVKDNEIQTYLLTKENARKLVKGRDVLKFEYEQHEERLLPRSKNTRINRKKQGDEHRADKGTIIPFKPR